MHLIWLFFTLAVLILWYAYLYYPALLRKKAVGKSISFETYTLQDVLPVVHIVIPACNEEKVIEEKLRSVLHTSYPSDQLQIHIGLDACTDATQQIVDTHFNLPNVHVHSFSERKGKPAILNHLTENTIPNDDSILILTDANVIFNEHTIFELLKYFKDEQIGLVDSSIEPKKVSNQHENDYWNYETEIKQNESIVYGKILGPSGGCYAIRRKLFTKIPDNLLVDDFFIGFNIIVQDYKAILNKQAICHEDVLTNWKQEFKRKVRIAAGNFQNLWRFRRYAFRWSTDVGFMFVSHKVIRWKTPFLLLVIYYILLLEWTLLVLIVTLFLPIIDLLLFTFGVEFKPLRRFHYFIVMNIAVFIGFIKFCKGVKTNVWQPTTRN